MSSYRQIYYQIVFGTKHRKPTLTQKHDVQLYKYISGIIKNKKCKLYCINGVEDHIHILCDIHPCVRLSELVKDIKVASSIWLKETGLFPDFEGWQEGYGAFTYSIRERNKIIGYINKQKQHHAREVFYDEYKRLLIENGVDFDEQYFV
jgi:putative transposase